MDQVSAQYISVYAKDGEIEVFPNLGQYIA
jgi:hypothetical protein